MLYSSAIYFVVLVSIILLTSLYFFNNSTKKKYLVFSSVGDVNNIQSWSSSPAYKNFDLVLYYYGDKSDPELDAEVVVKRKGLKFENFYHYLEHNNTSKYEAVWVVDDDIIMDTKSISEMFLLFTKYKLWLAQPSFSLDSFAPFIITRNKTDSVLHYTNFVENNVAIFSSDIIVTLKDTFREARTGFGVDYLWGHILKHPDNKIAVIDAVSCCHPISDYSALDEVVPRHLHKMQGAELLIKYGLLPGDWEPTELDPWPKPFELKEYLTIANSNGMLNQDVVS